VSDARTASHAGSASGPLKYVLRDLGPAAREFYARLAGGELATTRCPRCERLRFPPVSICPDCGVDAEWRALSGRGSVYAFTQQERGLRFTAPDVIGIAELEEGVRVFGVFDADYDAIAIGRPLLVELRDDAEGLTLLVFRLVER
jgi:uncharacterized protein